MSLRAVFALLTKQQNTVVDPHPTGQTLHCIRSSYLGPNGFGAWLPHMQRINQSVLVAAMMCLLAFAFAPAAHTPAHQRAHLLATQAAAFTGLTAVCAMTLLYAAAEILGSVCVGLHNWNRIGNDLRNDVAGQRRLFFCVFLPAGKLLTFIALGGLLLILSGVWFVHTQNILSIIFGFAALLINAYAFFNNRAFRI